MSGQGPGTTHKVRRSTTPPQMAQSRQGPLKAVQPFILKKNNPSRSPSSPNFLVRQRKSPGPEIGLSPDRRSPSSPGFKGCESLPNLAPCHLMIYETCNLVWFSCYYLQIKQSDTSVYTCKIISRCFMAFLVLQ